MPIKEGDKLPSAKLNMFKDGKPAAVTTEELFAGKKVVVFAVPGAFTPTCSMAHLPGFVVNADKIKLTGNKLDKKFYYRHSGIPGGFKQESARHLLARMPELPLEKAVKGMLPKNVLGREMLTKLKIYATADHPHAAQKPQPLNVKL